MWLLSTRAFVDDNERINLIQTWNTDKLPYAILSHTWSSDADQEISWKDLQYLMADEESVNAKIANKIKAKAGYKKLTGALRQAYSDKLDFMWIDTCCIDKSSSADLSEAINSMWRYYERARVCYAYLADVSISDVEKHAFCNSRWFSRGWTLQELVAPYRLRFFDSEWIFICNRHEQTAAISRRTAIPEKAICDIRLPASSFSVAARMSWAASREVSREEDVAYSLLGLLEVNMPLLYGEGKKAAFLRLQEEVMKRTFDQSIFAWATAVPRYGYSMGLLAESPADFMDSGAIKPSWDVTSVKTPTMTPRGLNISLHMSHYHGQYYLAHLKCRSEKDTDRRGIQVLMYQIQSEPRVFMRIQCCSLWMGWRNAEPALQDIIVSQEPKLSMTQVLLMTFLHSKPPFILWFLQEISFSRRLLRSEDLEHLVDLLDNKDWRHRLCVKAGGRELNTISVIAILDRVRQHEVKFKGSTIYQPRALIKLQDEFDMLGVKGIAFLRRPRSG